MTYPGIKRAEFEARDRHVVELLLYLLRCPDRTHAEMADDIAARIAGGAPALTVARSWARSNGLVEGNGKLVRYRLTEAGKVKAAEHQAARAAQKTRAA